jgi:glycosyltransferase involved in cell wall biosynthesis
MPSPTVSFVIPCYKLAHLLRECVHSILSQTYRDFEILIMDDCSPDNTPEVARSFNDSRIQHIRNDQNLGHLQNYNKGISISRGEYIWLISADDRLRRAYLLARYIRVFEGNPGVGYVCCPALKLQDGVETIVEGVLRRHDKVYDGKDFLKTLLKGNCIIAASGMVRRACYDTCGSFPLDLPYAGDWLLWCLFALHYRVAYFSEPMVNYRAHELSMTNYLMSHDSALALREGFPVLWRVRKQAQQAGANDIVRECEIRLARLYGMHLVGGKYGSWTYGMTEEELEASLVQETISGADQDWIRARAWETVGDSSFKRNDFTTARAYYRRALHYDSWMANVWAKQLLLGTGDFGVFLARLLLTLRDACS